MSNQNAEATQPGAVPSQSLCTHKYNKSQRGMTVIASQKPERVQSSVNLSKNDNVTMKMNLRKVQPQWLVRIRNGYKLVQCGRKTMPSQGLCHQNDDNHFERYRFQKDRRRRSKCEPMKKGLNYAVNMTPF